MRNESQSARAAHLAPGLLLALILLAFASPALAGPPTHLHNEALDIAAGFNHACGVAVDSKGDVYVSSAGESKVRIFNPAHTELTFVANANDPCGLAVNSKGELFVSEKATGKVVRYKPNAYPFSGTPSYSLAEPIDSSGKAKGIAVDPFDDRLYVAKGDRITVYKADGTPEPASNEVQRLRIVGSTGGTYTLTFRGQTTNPPLAFNASSAQVDAALEALSTIGPGNVAVTEDPPLPGDAANHKITFEGTLQNKTEPQLRGDGSKLTGGGFGLFFQTITQGFSGHIGEGMLSDATGVAAYTHKNNSFTGTDRYVYAADAATDEVRIFGGPDIQQIEHRRTIAGVDHDRNPETLDQSFGFGPAGAYLAVDPGNRNSEDKCTSVAEQACTAGHLLVYDDANEAVVELEANGEFLDQLTNVAFADAEPTAMAVERSGGPNDGTIYVSAGAGSGSKLLAFGPLAAPSRAPLPELSQTLAAAEAVATDFDGNVYVATSPRIHVYDPSGEEIEVGLGGGGIEDPNTPLGDLAVDSTGKVYVLEETNPDKVTYYTPSAYPPVDGTTYTRHEPPIAIDTEFPSGSQLIIAIAINPANDHAFVLGAGNITHEHDSAAPGHDSKLLNSCFACGLSLASTVSIAVNGANGNVYFGGNKTISVVNATGTEVLAQFNGAGSPKGQLPSNPKVAVDQSNGHVLIFDDGDSTREYDASGAFVAESGVSTSSIRRSRIAIDNSCALHDPPLTEETTPTCKQVHPSSGTVYVAYDDPAPGTFDLTAFDSLEYGEAPLAVTGIADGLGAGNATLNGTVNPRGFELTECKFEYLLDSQFLSNGKTFAGATSKACAEDKATIGKGDDPVPVHADLTSLDPDARYRFRLLARNKYGESDGGTWLFGPPAITTRTALPILYDEATLRAEVDPSGLATEYHFEYGKGAGEYDQSTPVAELPPGDGPVAVQAALTGLAEGTEYHFRIVAENEAEVVPGPGQGDQTLVTLERRPAEECPNVAYRAGLSAGLPDCRAYELVTPAETNGLSPLDPSPGGSGTIFNHWLVVQRGAGAGETFSYFTLGTLPGFDGNGRLDGYRAGRGAGEHPVEGWRSELFGPTFEESGPGSNDFALQQGVSSDQLYSSWKMNPQELHLGTFPAGVYLRGPSGFEALGQGSLGTDLKAKSQFVSAGGAHVIFISKEHLEPEAAPKGTEAIYDRAAGAPSATVVSVKPDGFSFAATEDAAYVASTEDGSAILFEVGGALYLRRGGQTLEVAASPNAFAGISEDGERIFYTDVANGSTPGELYAVDAETQVSTKVAEDSIFVNVSPEGSQAFFSSEEAIPGVEPNENGEAAEASKHNLYAWDAQTEDIRFIAQLDSQDFVSFAGIGGDVSGMDLGQWTTAISAGVGSGRAKSPTRSTPGGEVFLFQSHAQLSAYDNEGHGEVYRNDPAAEPGERLTCVSCDPSGAPPSADALLQDTSTVQTGVIDQTLIANVSDDGQEVFFQSSNRLLPEDANGVVDVYEWKAKGAGSCKRPGGCLALISSGQGERPNILYGMSADGDDVFFQTLEKLVGADVPGSPSIYDARVQGGIPDPPAAAPCQGDACQGQGSTPPALPAPGDETRSAGVEEEGAPKPRPCAKGKHRVKGRCVTRHHKRKRHHRRAGHNRGAQR